MNNFHILFCMFIAFSSFLLSAGVVKEDAKSITYRQLDKTEVTIPKLPKRVVISYGSLAQVWDLAGGSAVGVPDLAAKNALPEAMRNLPFVGSAIVPNLEKILTLQPDLVLLIAKLGRHRATADLLRQSGVNAVCVDYNNYSEFSELLDFFCRLNGKNISDVVVAQKLIDEVEEICKSVEGQKSPRCAIIFAVSTGFSLESSATNTGTMVEMLGGNNILKSSKTLRCSFSYEQLLLDNPDVILLITMGNAKGLQEKFRKEFMTQSAWQELGAAKNNRVHFLESELFLYMPSSRYPDAFRKLAKLLYPDLETKP